jgi:hypothetical protein
MDTTNRTMKIQKQQAGPCHGNASDAAEADGSGDEGHDEKDDGVVQQSEVRHYGFLCDRYQILQLMQQSIDAIVRFVHLIWSWSVDQITGLAEVPWDAWPLWKQVFLILVER